MKLTVDDATARVLIERLREEQPGSQLGDLRLTIQDKMAQSKGQPMTTHELNIVLQAVLDQEEALGKVGNPTATQSRALAILGSIVPKLQLMRDRQQSREREGTD